MVRGSGRGVNAPSTATCSALLTKHDKLKNRCESLMLKKQCMQGFVEEAKQLRAKTKDLKTTNTLAKGAILKRNNMKRPIVAEKRVEELEAESKASQDATRQRPAAVKESKRGAANTIAQLSASLRRFMEVL